MAKGAGPWHAAAMTDALALPPHATDTLLIPGRFCGPSDSGNGGWVSGALARRVDARCVSVRLSQPPPLDTELTVAALGPGEGVELRDGETLLATARPVEPLPAPTGLVPVTYDLALAASRAFPGRHEHAYPQCFACGTERDDGLRLETGPVPARSGLFAAPWEPIDVTPEIVWASLDCPGAWAAGAQDRYLLLGSITAQVDRLPEVGDRHVVVAWADRHEGRKSHTTCMLLDDVGVVIAQSRATWIEVSR